MGKRRGRTGPGGAVVSSLSGNAGGAVKTNTRRGQGQGAGQSVKGRQKEDKELLELANVSQKGRRKNASEAGPSNAETGATAGGGSSHPTSSSKWLGKSPQQMLREWCQRNNRKRPYFSKMQGSEGLMRCTIPAGRKDGQRVKGNAFNIIVGVGEQPGDEFAALNVLHQVERGKPLERLLAPQYRGVWLDLDKKFEEMEKQQTRKAAMSEKRKQATERRAKAEKSKESATISISAASRQMIEDALLEQKASAGPSRQTENAASSLTESVPTSRGSTVRKELVQMGFSDFDAAVASQMFHGLNPALDYLCLNLDESELPSSFAPTSDIEVVQFYSGAGRQTAGRIDGNTRDTLTRLLCLSKYAAEKALRKSDGDFDRAAHSLYNTLTHNLLADNMFPNVHGGEEEALLAKAAEEKKVEEESVEAIYGQDAKVGIGACSAFASKWAVVVRAQEGISGVEYSGASTVAFVDMDGFYPLSAPMILVGSDFDSVSGHKHSLSAAQRRLLTRATAGEVASLRQKSGLGEVSMSTFSTPVPVVHEVLSFLAVSSQIAFMSSASGKRSHVHQVNVIAETGVAHADTLKPRKNTASGAQKSSQNRVLAPRVAEKLKDSPELADMRGRRRSLPAYATRSEIIETVSSCQVTVVSGATGSGKTTQVPQFLLEDATDTGKAISIVCTQPRRIAAISVAERVAAERCQKVGESVGYQVKLNTKRSADTRLTFCTTGVLLRRLQGDPQLHSVTHVLVDEVHERSVETDFLLLLLREIVTTSSSLRVVLMSATLDAEKFSRYFSSAMPTAGSQVPVISIPGRTYPVDEYYLEDVVQLTNYSLKPGDRFAKRVRRVAHTGKYGPEPSEDAILPVSRMSAAEAAAVDDPTWDDYSDDEERPPKISNRVPERLAAARAQQKSSALLQEGRSNKEILSLIDESLVNVDLIDLLVKRIDDDGRSTGQMGAILIFLPGAAEILSVIQKLSSGAGSHCLWILPLHSLLSPDEQANVFRKPPQGKRKVICATNIAETSITVEDVSVVIDTLRAKEMGYDALNGSSVLEECFISKAAAKQRTGRAGRVSRGTCYRLVREHTFDNRIAPDKKPEIQRVSLEHLVLNILSIIPESQSQNDPHGFLAKAVDPPSPEAVTTAVTNLIEIGALQRRESDHDRSARTVDMTALGKHLSGLPVDARIGKLLVYGSVFSCIDSALTIAATISERSPFYAPFDKREEARAARQHFVWGKSDLLTYVKAFNGWRDIRASRSGYQAETQFCSQYFLSRKTLQTISDGRKQLADALVDAGFGPPGDARARRGWESLEVFNKHSDNARVLKAVVCAALYPNISRIDLPTSKYREVAGGNIREKYNSKDLKLRAKNGERLFLHPESVNFFEGNFETRWLAYFTKVKTSKLFIRDSTMVSPYAILLFGGEIGVLHQKGQMSVDRWILFKAPARVAVLARELRRELDGLLMRKFDDADMDVNAEGRVLNDAIIRLITLES